MDSTLNLEILEEKLLPFQSHTPLRDTWCYKTLASISNAKNPKLGSSQEAILKTLILGRLHEIERKESFWCGKLYAKKVLLLQDYV